MILINILLLNNLTSENLATGLKQANLASRNNIANFVKKIDLNKNELNKLSKKVKATSKKKLKLA